MEGDLERAVEHGRQLLSQRDGLRAQLRRVHNELEEERARRLKDKQFMELQLEEHREGNQAVARVRLLISLLPSLRFLLVLKPVRAVLEGRAAEQERAGAAAGGERGCAQRADAGAALSRSAS